MQVLGNMEICKWEGIYYFYVSTILDLVISTIFIFLRVINHLTYDDRAKRKYYGLSP